ncbi:MAG: MFS transporter [Deferrisomatales bacterium]
MTSAPDSTGTRPGPVPYGYVIAAACFSIQGVGIGCYLSFGVFFKPILAEFGWSRATLSGAQSAAFLLMGILGILVGRLNDRVGPRRVMVGAALFFGGAYLLMARLGSVWQLYLFYGLLFGVGLSAVDVIPLTTIARWFERRRGVMTGIVKVGTGAGQMTIPLAASLLIAGYGWRTTYAVMGVAAMVALIGLGLLLRRDPGQHDAAVRARAGAAAAPAAPADLGLTADEAFRTRQFWTLCGVTFATVYCLLTVMVHIVPHARDFTASATAAAGVLSVIGGVSMAGRLATGLYIDRVGSRRTMLLSFLLLTSSLAWLQAAREPWMLYGFALVYGLGHGAFFTSLSPLVAELFGVRAHGALFGMVSFWGNLGGALGPLLAGYLFDLTGAYRGAFGVCVGMSLAALALLATLRPIPRSTPQAG